MLLKIDHTRNMIYNPNEAISFEGDTGPYLLYTYARARSIISKSKKPIKLEIPKTISSEESSLISQLTTFPEIVKHAYETYSPNIIANYTYRLAQSFNEFYHKHKVIGSEEESFRIALVKAASQVIKNSLYLLGIQTLEKM